MFQFASHVSKIRMVQDHLRCMHTMIIHVQTQVEFEIHHAKMSNLTQVFVFSENKPICKIYISFIILHHIPGNLIIFSKIICNCILL